MKEAAKILSLLVLLLALAAAPWLLLQQQSAMVDNTVHREAVALDGPEAIDGGSFSVMDRLTLISQSVYDTGSYVVTPLDNSSPSVTLRLDLILEQLSDASETTVAEMIYIVCRADSVRKRYKVVDRGEDIVLGYVLGAQLIYTLRRALDYKGTLVLDALLLGFIDYLSEHRDSDLLSYARVLEAVAEDICGVSSTV